MSFSQKKPEKDDTIKLFLKSIGIKKRFYIITLTGYFVSTIFRGIGVTMVIPLTKGLIEKNYDFIFNNSIVAFIVNYIPYIREMTDTHLFILFIAGVFFVLAVSMGINFFISMYVWNQKEHYSLVASKLILKKLLVADGDFYEKNKTSALRARLAAVSGFVKAYIDSFNVVVQTCIETLVALVILFAISVKLAIVTSVLILFATVIIYLFKRKITKASSMSAVAEAEFSAFMQDVLNKKDLIHSYDTQYEEKNNFVEEYGSRIEQKRQIEKVNRFLEPVTTFMQVVMVGIVSFFIGSNLFLTSTMSVPAGIMFVVVSQRAMTKSNTATLSFLRWRGAIEGFTKLLKNIISNKSYTKSGKILFTGLESDIEIKNLNFAYGKTPIFNNFNATIPFQKITMIVGSNGSGKSTILSLLMRLKNCKQDSIFVNEKDIELFNNASWKSNISYVAQNILMFNGTLGENIRYGNSDATDTQVMDILKKVGMDVYVKSLPNGLDTKIKQDGQILSGGQRQRIAIARALLRKSDIVIFDEATKSVDQETEAIIWNILTHELAHTTRIIVSHDREHQKFADSIIDLDTV